MATLTRCGAAGVDKDMTNLEAREFSKRLGVLSPAQLQAALDRFGLGRLLGAEPAPQGLFGQNLFLRSSEGDFVLRGRPHYQGQLHKERFFARALHERTRVPAPWPYLIDESVDIFGWEYAIMPRMPGVQIGDPEVRRTLGDDDKQQIAHALGASLGDLHELKLPFPAEYDHQADATRPFPVLFPAHILGSMESWYERCRASDALNGSDLDWCRAVVEGNAAALEVPFEPTFVHHDYKEANSVASREAGGWRISGVFDLMEWYIGDPEEDLVRTVWEYSVRAASRIASFIAGYRAAATLRPGYDERFRIYMLRDCLLLWEYGHRTGTWSFPARSFRAWAEPFVACRPFDR